MMLLLKDVIDVKKRRPEIIWINAITNDNLESSWISIETRSFEASDSNR